MSDTTIDSTGAQAPATEWEAMDRFMAAHEPPAEALPVTAEGEVSEMATASRFMASLADAADTPDTLDAELEWLHSVDLDTLPDAAETPAAGFPMTREEWEGLRQTVYQLAATQHAEPEPVDPDAPFLDPYAPPGYLENLAEMLEAREQDTATRLGLMGAELEQARADEATAFVETVLNENNVRPGDRERVKDWAFAEFQALQQAFPDADPRIIATAAISHSASLLDAESELDATRRVFGIFDDEEL